MNHIFVSGLVYTKRIKIKILASICKEIQVHFVDKRNICGFNLFKDDLHLLDSGKRLLANNFVDNFNNFLSVIHRPSLFS